MSKVMYSSSLLMGTNKVGLLRPDENGYRAVSVAGLNTFNRGGDYYSAKEAIRLYEDSSILMRRVKGGSLYAENGHPEPLPGQSLADFYNRIVKIKEDRICAHFNKVWLDLDFGRNNPGKTNPEAIGVFANMIPAGELGYVVENALKNKEQNLPFSQRGLNDVVETSSGILERHLTTIVTFDYVNEPGIPTADRNMAPSLESSQDAYQVHNVSDILIDVDIFMHTLTNNMGSISAEDSNMAYFEGIKESISKVKAKDKKASKVISWFR